MKITIERRDQYGRPVYFPMDHYAQTFARIAGTKTLTPEALALIMSLGYQIEIKHPETTF